MPSTTLDLARAAPGDRVQHEFLILERDERRLASGDPFVVLTLGNATGRIATAPIWSQQLDWAAGAERGRVVQVIGEVGTYHGRRQVRLTAPLRVLPDALVRAEQFLPGVGVAPEVLWDWIDRARAEIRSRAWRRAVDLFFADDQFRLDFERLPASLAFRDAAVGGLLLHATEVARIARNSARVLRANPDLVLAGALLRDVGKVKAFDAGPTGFSLTLAGELVGHATLGALMLEERLQTVPLEEISAESRIELHHLILAQPPHGQASSPVQPRTLEAEILCWADELTARAGGVSFVDQTIDGSPESTLRQRLRSFDTSRSEG